MKLSILFLSFPIVIFYSCSPAKQIAKSAKQNVLNDPALKTAHVGISVYDPSTNKYLYNYQADKYFVPASNTKLPTCYAAMKYLGDSLVGLRYVTNGTDIRGIATADPSFLHPDFPQQPVYDFLKSGTGNIMINISGWKDRALGSGWSWNDYSEDYMAERSPMPIYGNLARFSSTPGQLKVIPKIFAGNITDSFHNKTLFPSSVTRDIAANKFFIDRYSEKPVTVETPIYTKGEVIFELLSDTLGKTITRDTSSEKLQNGRIQLIYSQATDSLLRPMMHQSDNFFAEQTLLMVSNEKLGIMSDSRIIDTLLKTDLKDLPQKPRWVDGSGLSRFNLFTPQDFVTILNKMKNEFGMERIKEILPTGNEGTLEGLYTKETGYIFAKTGTLSGVIALSGFLYTNKNKLLIFSILVNNHQASSDNVRSAIEKFVKGLRNRY
jgi:D-alanyl-D-alanine carboxypeptidase/D-alanyl-D-alanine-endopeptidase (penicillin-binding protein 4)